MVVNRAMSSLDGEETTPLLQASRSLNLKATPLPVQAIFVLCVMRASEPIALSVIFPFINQMIEDLHIASDPADVTYYAGIIESLFAFTTFMTVLLWGRLSDRIGRKPVLLMGLIGVGSSVAVFGLGRSLLSLCIVRAISGGLNGNAAVIKSVLGDISDASNQGRVFSFLPLSWSLGSVIGPIIGGFLSNPAKNFSMFKDIVFFQLYPYALPCFVAALFPFGGALLGTFFLNESLPSRKNDSRADEISRISTTIPAPSSSTTATVNAAAVEEEVSPPPPFKKLFTREVFSVLAVYSLLALQTISLDILLIQFLYTPVASSGLGFSSPEIGIALALSGGFTVTSQLLLFPPLQSKFGTVWLYRRLMGLYPLVFTGFSVLSWLSGRGEGRTVIWSAMVVLLVMKAIGNMAYGCSMLAVNSSCPDTRLLGGLNGLAQMFSSLMRSIGPFLTSVLFAFTIKHQVWRGQFAFFVVGVVSLIAWASTLLLKVDKDWRVVKLERQREEERRD